MQNSWIIWLDLLKAMSWSSSPLLFSIGKWFINESVYPSRRRSKSFFTRGMQRSLNVFNVCDSSSCWASWFTAINASLNSVRTSWYAVSLPIHGASRSHWFLWVTLGSSLIYLSRRLFTHEKTMTSIRSKIEFSTDWILQVVTNRIDLISLRVKLLSAVVMLFELVVNTIKWFFDQLAIVLWIAMSNMHLAHINWRLHNACLRTYNRFSIIEEASLVAEVEVVCSLSSTCVIRRAMISAAAILTLLIKCFLMFLDKCLMVVGRVTSFNHKLGQPMNRWSKISRHSL